jgi:hypothetical protein
MRPNSVRFLTQDFPTETRAWLPRLLGPLNHFMTSVSSLLNNGLTFKDHMNSEIKTITVSSKDSPTVSCNLRSKPIGALVIHSDQELASPLSIDWKASEGGIKIRKILGLEENKAYELTILIIGG